VLVTLVRRVSMIMPSFLRSAKRDDGANFFHAGVDASDVASGLPAREKAVGGWQNSAPPRFRGTKRYGIMSPPVILPASRPRI
jgi:hypothetical protein